MSTCSNHQGANSDLPSYVYKLQKSIDSLKQAPRVWFSNLNTKLSELGFKGSRSDSSLFISIQLTASMY